MIENELNRIRKKAVVADFNVIYHYFPEVTKEIKKRHSELLVCKP
jgi:hypothetical protein